MGFTFSSGGFSVASGGVQTPVPLGLCSVFAGEITESTTFSDNDSGKVFYSGAANLNHILPNNPKQGFTLCIIAPFECTVSCSGSSVFVGLATNPNRVTLGSPTVSVFMPWFDGSNWQVIAASPDIYQAYNSVSGNGAQIVTPLTVTGANTINSGNNIVLTGAQSGQAPTITASGIDNLININIEGYNGGTALLNSSPII